MTQSVLRSALEKVRCANFAVALLFFTHISKRKVFPFTFLMILFDKFQRKQTVLVHTSDRLPQTLLGLDLASEDHKKA